MNMMKSSGCMTSNWSSLYRMLFHITMILILLSNIILLSGSAEIIGSCMRIPTSSICSDIIDYHVYVPASQSLPMLELQAYTQLSYPYLPTLSSSCQSAVKSLVCVSIYHRCITQDENSNIIVDSSNSLDYSLYPSTSYGVSIVRPCKSHCDRVFSDVCWNTYNHHIFPFFISSCDDRYDYSFGNQSLSLAPARYDASNNILSCHILSHDMIVAERMEVYPSHGVCEGVLGLSSSIFIPSGASYGIHSMQPPGIMLSILESYAYNTIHQLPSHLSSSCHDHMVQYICQSTFKKAQRSYLSSYLHDKASNTHNQSIAVSSYISYLHHHNATTYFPQYPSKSSCIDVIHACPVLLSYAYNVDEDELVPTICDADTISIADPDTRISYFPDVDMRIISSYHHHDDYLVDANFTSYVDISGHVDSDSQFQTRCPHPYVVPDDPDGDGVVMIPGTGCAVACYSNGIYTKEEQSQFNSILAILSSIAVPFGLAFLWHCYYDAELSKLIVVYWFGLISFTCAMIFLAVVIVNMHHSDTPPAFCLNNAEGISSKDGVTLCSIQAVGLFGYLTIALRWSWFVLAFDVYLKINLRIRDTKGLRPVYGFIIFIFPIAHVIDVLSTNSYGYKLYGFPTCYISNPSDLNSSRYVIDYPSIGIIAAGVPFIVSSCYRMIKLLYFQKPVLQGNDKLKNKKRKTRKRSAQSGEFSRPARPSYLQQGLPGPHHLEFSSSIDPTSESASYAFAAKGESVVTSFRSTISRDTHKSKHDHQSNDHHNHHMMASFHHICDSAGFDEASLLGTLALLFISFALFVHITYLNLTYDNNNVVDAYREWTTCIFTHPPPLDSYAICGSHSSTQPASINNIRTGLCTSCGMIIVTSIIFLSNHQLWRRFYDNHISAYINDTRSHYNGAIAPSNTNNNHNTAESPAKPCKVIPSDLPLVIKREIYLPTANPSEIEFGTRRQNAENVNSNNNSNNYTNSQQHAAGSHVHPITGNASISRQFNDELTVIHEIEDVDLV